MGRGYPRRPGMFPIGLGIFPPAGDIPDGSEVEDKGVKGTFLVSGGNIPGGPGISPGCPGTLPRTGSPKESPIIHQRRNRAIRLYTRIVFTLLTVLSIYLLDRNTGRCFNFFRLRNLQTDRQAGRQTIKRDGVRPTHLITSSHPSSRPSRPCTRPSAPRCCCCCRHRRRRRCSCTWPRRSSSGSA